jgi:Fur family transcriptional regulator, ferric uptake regulator
MADHEDQARTILRDAGLRCTHQRVQLVACLAAMPRHFGAEEARHALRALPRSPVSRATLYRLLADLERHGLLRRVLLSEGHSHYEFVAEREQHCHLVCAACGRVEEVRSHPLERLVRRLGGEYGFAPQGAEVEISVEACGQCAAPAEPRAGLRAGARS